MKHSKLLMYALIGGGLYYLWSKSSAPATPAATLPATAAPTTPLSGFGHGNPMGYGGMGRMGFIPPGLRASWSSADPY